MAGARGGFTHLDRGVVEAHDAGADGRKARRGHAKCFAVERIEALRNIASELEVLGLVFANGNDGGLVEQNIGSHQDGILQQARADRFLGGGFGFVLRHALEPADGRDAGEHPGELGMRGDG